MKTKKTILISVAAVVTAAALIASARGETPNLAPDAMSRWRYRCFPKVRLRLATTFVACVLATAMLASPAGAVTNGEPDGNGHPYVGVLVAEWATPGVKQRFCSATLVAQGLVVTAAHCLGFLESHGLGADEMWVSFDPVYDQATSTLYHGIIVADPEFSDYSGQYGESDPHDIAVVHLDQAPSITPASLPTAGLLSSLDLRGQTFTAVGYGRYRVDKTKGPNNIEPNYFPDVRNVATQEFLSLQPNLLTMSKNAATGDGGWCYGDSGSADYLGESNLAVSISILTDTQCRALDQGYRLDTESARQFLASQGVPLP